MHEQFNLVSLANLSRAELFVLLAKLQSQFYAASGEAERMTVHAKIEAVKRALAL
jgi:hypothetical protein